LAAGFQINLLRGRNLFPGIALRAGLIKVPKNEAEKIFAVGRVPIFYSGRTRGNLRRFQGDNGLLYAVVHGQALLRQLGLALDDGSF
jgi:hypothetical protein